MSMTDEEIVKVVQGRIDGKTIECRYTNTSRWFPARTPLWSFEDTEYRVKPEARKVWGYMDHVEGHYLYKDSKPNYEWDEVIEFVEVMK
jgi:hypothetical protein